MSNQLLSIILQLLGAFFLAFGANWQWGITGAALALGAFCTLTGWFYWESKPGESNSD